MSDEPAPRQPEDIPPLDAPPKAYDAFISYRHDGNREVARALQKGLQRMAKPWNRRRALQVFRDETGLSADPSLWRSICGAMDGSQWLVYLASPESRQSDWVGHELRRWLRYRSPDRIMVAITAGELRWHPDGTLDTTSPDSAAHPALAGVLTPETKYIDISWARSETGLTLRNARFRDAVADLAAPMHGKPKDELEGDDVREQRRTVRLARSAVAGLTVLALAAAGASVVAVANAEEAAAQRDVARAEQARAEAEARVATSRLLAAQALANPGTDGSLGYLLAARAYRLAPTTAALGALYQLTQVESGRSAQVRAGGAVSGRVVGHSRAVAAATFSPDGSVLATADFSTLRLFPGDGGAATAEVPMPGVGTLAWSPQEGLVAAGFDGLLLVDTVDGRTTPLPRGPGVVVDVVRAGDLVVVVGADGTVSVVQDGSVSQLDVTVPRASAAVGAADADVVAVQTPDEVVVLDARSGAIVSRFPAQGELSDVSADGGRISLVHPEWPLEMVDTDQGPGWVAARVLDTADGDELQVETVREPYLPQAATFLPGTSTLVLGTSGGVDQAPGQLFVRDPDRAAADALGALTPPDTVEDVVVSGDGARLLVTDGAGTGVVLPLRSSGHVATSRLAVARDAPRALALPASSGTAGSVASIWAAADAGGPVDVLDLTSGEVVGSVPGAGNGAALTPDGERVLTEDGRVVAVDGAQVAHDGLPPVGGDVVFAPDGTRALYPSGDERDLQVVLVDLVSGQSWTAPLGLDRVPGSVVALAWSADDGHAVVLTQPRGADERYLWALAADDALRLRTSTVVPTGTDALAFVGGGDVVVGDGDAAQALDPATLEPTGVTAYAPVGRSWAVSPDGSTLMATATDCALLLVDPATWQVAADVEMAADFVETGCEPSETAWSDAGSLIVTSFEGRLTTIPTDPEILLRSACALAARDMTEAEWAQFLPERPYEATCGPDQAETTTPGPSTTDPGGTPEPSDAAVPVPSPVDAATDPVEPDEPVETAEPVGPVGPVEVDEGDIDELMGLVSPAAVVCEPDLTVVPCVRVLPSAADEVVLAQVPDTSRLGTIYRVTSSADGWQVTDTYEFGGSGPLPDWATVLFEP